MNTNLAYQDYPAEELIGGKFVAMSPRPSVNHNHVSFNIARIFADYLKGKRCTPFADGVDLYLTDEDRFIPDMMVVCDPDKVKADGVYGAPDLVVEVLSPSTAQYDRGRKMRVYAQCGVRTAMDRQPRRPDGGAVSAGGGTVHPQRHLRPGAGSHTEQDDPGGTGRHPHRIQVQPLRRPDDSGGGYL